MTAIALQHRELIIERVASGEYLASIAQSLGLKGKGQSLSDYLANDPEYQHAREFGLEAKLAKREAETELAKKDDVPRARELLSHARWRAERECPARWGAKQQMTVDVHHDVSDRLQADLSALLGRVVETQQIVHRDSAEEGIGVMSSHDALPEHHTSSSNEPVEHDAAPMHEDDPVSP